MGKGCAVSHLPAIVLVTLFFVVSSAQRYEFKHSFRPPFFLGRGGALPFWEFGGSSVVLEDFIRLTPATQSKVGWLWNTVPVDMDSWETHVELQVGGGGKVGADGMALWYVSEPKMEGTVLGSKDYFNGVGILFDTFDNDGKGDNPSVMLVVNDGTKSYDAAQDGGSIVVGSCKLFAREKRAKVKVTYQNSIIQISLETQDNMWELCTSSAVHLEKGKYFGVSAATGYLFDAHDIYSWVTYNLDPWRQASTSNGAVQHADIKERLDSLTENPPGHPRQPSSQQTGQEPHFHQEARDVPDRQNVPEPVQQTVQQPTPPQPVPVQQPIPVQHQQSVQHPAQQPVPVHQTVRQSGPQPVPITHSTPQSPQQPQQPVQHLTPQPDQETRLAMKQLQGQMETLQQQQAQIVASVNQLTAELRSISAARNNPSNDQPQVFADALEKLLAIVSDTKTIMQDNTQVMRNNLLDIKHSLSAPSGNANQELIAAVNDVRRNVAKVQTAVEVAKKEQTNIVTDLQANKEMLMAKIEQGSSFGFWTFFLFFQVCFALAFVFYRKLRDDSSKKFD